MNNHTLMFLACEHMVIGVKQLQRKKWAGEPIDEMRTRDKQPINILCTDVRQLPMKDLCVGVRQLQLEDMNQT